MGKNFRVANPVFVDDTMYEAPHEYMLKALQFQDEQFKKQQDTIDSYSTMADSLKHVDGDSEERKQLLDAYRNKGAEIAEKIQANPAMYQAYAAEINKAKRDLEAEVKTGSLYNMDRSFKNRDIVMKDLKDRLDKGTLGAEEYQEAVSFADRSYKGQSSGELYADNVHTFKTVDTNEFQEHLKKTITPDSIGSSTTRPDGDWYMKTTGSTKSYVDAERIREVVKSDETFKNWEKSKLQTYERQLERGAFSSREEMNAKFLNDKEELIENSVKKLGYTQRSSESSMSNDAAFAARDAANHRNKLEAAMHQEVEIILEGANNANSEDAISRELAKTQGRMVDNNGKLIPNPNEAQFRQAIAKEKAVLMKTLTTAGMDEKSFLAMMEQEGGANKISLMTKIPVSVLARQANTNTNYKYETIKSPIDGGKNGRANASLRASMAQNVNTLGGETNGQLKIVDANNNIITNKKMTLAEMRSAGIIDPKYLASRGELQYDGILNGYLTNSGEGILKNPDGTKMTKQEAEDSGMGLRAKEDGVKLDGNSPILSIEPERLRQTKRVDYGNGVTKPKISQKVSVILSMLDPKTKQYQTVIWEPDSEFKLVE